MKRITTSSRNPLRLATVAALSVVAMLAGLLFVASGPIGAQALSPATFVVSATSAVDDVFEVTVDFSPGDEIVGAISGRLTYDTAAATAFDCVPGVGGGSCNAANTGEVLFALFDSGAFEGADEAPLVTVSFAGDGVADLGLNLELRGVYGLDGELPVLTPVVEYVLENETAPENAPEGIGALTGEVTYGNTGEGLFGLEVCALNIDDGTASNESEVCVTTDGLGNYVIGDLPIGLYAVRVRDDAGLYGQDEQAVVVNADETAFALFVLDAATGAPVEEPEPVEEPQPEEPPSEEPPAEEPPTAEVPVLIEPPAGPTDALSEGRITGTVLNSATGSPIFGVVVCATIPVVGTTECQATNTSGEYQIDGLRTSNYVVSASDPVQRYTGDDETLIGVFAGSAVAGVDFELDPR